MSDWQVGDLAVCVDDRPCHNSGALCPCKLGHVYRVAEVVLSSNGLVGLRLDGVTFPTAKLDAIYHTRFRKIRPDEREACEPEFVTLLKRLRSPAKVE